MIVINQALKSCDHCGNAVCIKVKFRGEFFEATATCKHCGKLVTFRIGDEIKKEQPKRGREQDNSPVS